MPAEETIRQLDQRITRLEDELRRDIAYRYFTQAHFLILCPLMLLALGLCIRGLQMPNHPYQGVLGAVIVALAYHRGLFKFPDKIHEWILPPLNVLTLAILSKLFVGGGMRTPLYWMQYPVVKSAIPNFELMWQPSSLAIWEIDVTVIQSFLILVTLAGAIVRFQLFASLTAFLLLLFSLPALLEFDWQWVFPGLLVAAVGFYLQTTGVTASRP